MLFILNAFVAVALIILILLQRADPGTGGAFGGGSGGAQPIVRNPLAKPTAILAAIFLVNSLVIAYTQQGAGQHASVVESHEATEATPAMPMPELPVTLDGANGSSLPAPELPTSPTEVSPTQ